MTPQERAKYFPYQGGIDEHVYDSLLGHLIPECRIPWVENIFVPGNPCYQQYSDMHDAYAHLRDRLGVKDEDQDAEIMINSLIAYGKIVALKMFEYGRAYQKMLDSPCPKTQE